MALTCFKGANQLPPLAPLLAPILLFSDLLLPQIETELPEIETALLEIEILSFYEKEQLSTK